jgi:hypothetical protein
MALELVPITRDEARAFIERHHRHNPPPPGWKFGMAVADEGEVVGVAMVGRPVARHADDGWTLEVNRVCTDGSNNACSMLYGACWRAAKALGYRKLITYTMESEPGTSLRAAGWRVVGEVDVGSWSSPSRPRVDKHPTQRRIKWEAAS